MKQYKSFFTGASMAVVLAASLSACHDFDNPTINAPVATITANTSILDLKEKYWNDADNYIDTVRLNDAGQHIIVSGRVISSDQTGNIYKSLVIQDETAALAMSIDYSNMYVDYRVGQEVVIDVTDMFIGKYSSLQQLGYPDYSGSYGWQAIFMPYELFKEHSQLNGNPRPELIDTLTITIDQLSKTPEGLRKMQSQLVRLNNVHFADGGKAAFCTEHKVNTNRSLLDNNGNSITVRTSGYARFWSNMLPEGAGDVVGILSYNGSGDKADWQLVIRSLSDLMNFGNPTLEAGTESNPYTIEQVVAIENSTSTTAGWVKGFIIGAVKGEVTEVTSADDIEWTAPTEMNNTLVIGVSADTRDIDKCLVVALPQGSALREYGNLRDNAANLGRSIMIYGTFDRYMSTYGITNNRGTVNEFRIEGIEPAGSGIATGDGSEASPYNPTQIVAMGTDANVADKWMKGYIVGWINNKVNGADQNYADANNTFFTVPAELNTNILVATTPDETDFNKCVAVNLPNSNGIREALNLVTNPGNLGKVVELRGTIRKYFSIAGFRDITEFKFDGSGSTPEQPVEPGSPVTSLNVDFEGVTALAQLPGWTSKDVSGNKSWFFRSYSNNSFAEITAYNGTPGNNGFDSWLITPALNVDGMSKKSLSFSSCVGYQGNGTLEVYAMSTADPATATLTRLNATIPQPTGSWSEFEGSGEISLAAFSGTIYIGFRYTAASGANYTTYRVDNVVAGESTSGGETPGTGNETPDTPSTGEGSASQPYSVADVIALNPTSTSVLVKEGVWVTGYIVGYVDTNNGNSATDANVVFGAGGKTYSNILIAESADVTDYHKCVAVQLPSGSAVRKAINLGDNPAMLGQQVSVKGNIRLYVGLPGVHTPTDYNLGATGK